MPPCWRTIDNDVLDTVVRNVKIERHRPPVILVSWGHQILFSIIDHLSMRTSFMYEGALGAIHY